MKETTVPAAPGFYALFLSPKGLSIPRRFFRHAVVAWEIHQTESDSGGNLISAAWPICVTENGGRFDFIEQPDKSLVHVTGTVCGSVEEAIEYALDQEAMAFGRMTA